MENQSTFINDITPDQATRSASGWSMSPEKVGQMRRSEYAAHLERFKETILKAAGADREAEALECFARYREGYRKRYSLFLARESNTISTFITGPANFPVRRAEKANAAARRAYDDLVDWSNNVRRRMLRQFSESHVITSGAPNALEQLRARVAELEGKQEKMRAANAIFRSKKLSQEEKYAALEEIGISQKKADVLAEGDYLGRTGYADFELTNNSANLRRMRQRLEAEERRLAYYEAEPPQVITFDGGELVENRELNRMQFLFNGKPAAPIIEDLKRSGWKWSPKEGAWQRQLTGNAQYSAKTILTRHLTGWSLPKAS